MLEHVINFSHIIRFKNYKYIIKRKKYLFKNNDVFGLIFILIYFLYLFSLEGCFDGEDICSTKIIWIRKKIVEEIISCIIMEIMVELMIFKIISRFHLLHIIIFFLLCLNYSHGVTFDNHGYFNFIYYFIILSLLTIIICLFFLMIYCVRKYKDKNIFFFYFNNNFFFPLYILFFFFFF